MAIKEGDTVRIKYPVVRNEVPGRLTFPAVYANTIGIVERGNPGPLWGGGYWKFRCAKFTWYFAAPGQDPSEFVDIVKPEFSMHDWISQYEEKI